MSADAELVNLVRRERTQRLFLRASTAIESWLQRREARDVDAGLKYVGRHESQRTALMVLLTGAARTLGGRAASLPVDGPTGEHFDRCRVLDEAAVWLERLWEFYRAKFDQRDDPGIGPVVHAADEVVWSCYHPVMARARGKHPPQPLPFLASEYSPAALESDKPVPSSLRPSLDPPDWTDGLRVAAGSLPVTLLRLPPWCVEDPWWLVFIAHEVGHHVQADLRLVASFATTLEQAAAAAGAAAEASSQWGRWSREIFADAFSIMSIGRAAVVAVAEVEQSTDVRMRAATATYPPPAVRLDLMDRIASLAGLPRPGGDQAAALAVVESIAEACLAKLPVIDRTLADLCDLQPSRFRAAGVVAAWKDRLLAARPAAAVPNHDTARMVVAASLAAWQQVAATTDPGVREARRRQLSDATIAALRSSTPPGVRAPMIDAAPPLDAAGLVDALVEAAHTYGTGQGGE